MKAHIVVVGSLNMDLVVRTRQLPVPGETVLADGGLTRHPGGKGANQAVAAARLGARVAMVGRVGTDPYGAELVEGLIAEGIDTRHIVRDLECATGIALITVDESGQNSIVVASGANGRLTEVDVEAAHGLIEGADVVLLQLETPLPVVASAAGWARSRGVMVILNPAPAQPLPPALLSDVDVLIPNESEVATLSRAEGAPECDVEAFARMMPGKLIVTRGDRGALLYGEGETRSFSAYPVRAVDTTAAGDAFVAGIAVSLAEGSSFDDAVRFASAAGACAVTRPGAQPSLPDRMAVERMMAGHNPSRKPCDPR